MTDTKRLFVGFIGFSLAAFSSASGLEPLLLEGAELYHSLHALPVEKPIRHLPAHISLPRNPYASTDSEFVEAVAKSSSQGRLHRDGIRSALYAFYVEDKQLGFYGLEAASALDADRREAALREIWTYNVSVGRAQVHRHGLLLAVVWHDGVSPECWAAVNRKVVEKLSGRGPKAPCP